MLPLMVRPISLKLRPHELTARARLLLKRFDDEQRVKFLASKALSAVYEMEPVAAEKLRSMSADDRDAWQADYKSLVEVLRRIQKRGV